MCVKRDRSIFAKMDRKAKILVCLAIIETLYEGNTDSPEEEDELFESIFAIQTVR